MKQVIGMQSQLLLVRFGEIGLKGKNRSQFVQQLVNNLRQALQAVESVHVEAVHGRVYVSWSGAAREKVYDAVASTFGVVSFSPALRVDLDLEAMGAAAESILADALQQQPARSFKVDARRAFKAFPCDSIEINRRIGSRLAARFPSLQVDVHRPDVTVEVEVREEGAFLCAERIPGPGGLPVGTSGRALVLLSGGIDSPVAAWYALKRGIQLEAVHFHSFPFTSERSLQKVVDLGRILARYAGELPLHVVHFTEIQTEIQKTIPESFSITIMRRMMFRIAERIARERQALALVTGESVGQVASQTLESIHAINDAVTIPVLRPLVGFDKAEIIERAEAIGTYETSILPYEDCCTIFVPKRPQTRPKTARAQALEARLDVENLIERALANTRIERLTP